METRCAIRIGTCSWTERSLIESGSFYPPEVTNAEQRLRYYSSRFTTVEIDSSYYSIPTQQMAQAWVERTPENFLFHVKAYGALTGHSIDATLLPKQLRELLPEPDRDEELVHVSEPAPLKAMAQAFVDALEPLKSAHKLGFIIFQFPPWFTHKKANLAYLLYCKELVAGHPIAVEFRHGSWLTRQHAEDLFAFLHEHKITYITCDEPQYGNLTTAPFFPHATTSMAYLRLHGRNAESWQERSDRQYEYLYTESELWKIAREARRLSDKTRVTFIMFNNSHKGNAIRNALRIREILREMC